ncbi:riboflavin biosynthesis pyrimidine reductase [Herbihabitans rhizosphaerae]|uniref:Riboflavin biosynthesis pyrimidine reductase n=1 Tax=Herbihabitans rhizosphaerae TaxID=1872711 RepID=A0A4Q7L543_9PSEU|nr:pyrimidine reductase family protein [Herbihabitans rhizosphaerae]RZS43641.1 riboflavin biosynthesis pyrimidine reductase [Herbihabitans rhizosphaerae]
MRQLWPEPLDEVDDTHLEKLYAYPENLVRPWIQVNFVSSTDGAVTAEGRSEGLSGPADQRIFRFGRDLCDVVLVGAGTATVEGYRGIGVSGVRGERRARLGLAPVPPIAVVSARGTIAPDAPLITDTEVPTIVITSAAAPKGRRAALADAGADVVVAGDDGVHLPTAMDALAERGLLRVCCEGGPRLFGTMIADGLVDQLCLTVSPLITGGDASRIAVGPLSERALELDLASVLTEDGFLMLRYRVKSS